MNFATWSIRNPVPTILLFALLSFAGFYGFKQLPIQNFPDIDLPAVNVTMSLPGAAPAQLATMNTERKLRALIFSLLQFSARRALRYGWHCAGALSGTADCARSRPPMG